MDLERHPAARIEFASKYLTGSWKLGGGGEDLSSACTK